MATAIRRGGSIPPEVSMEFEARWKESRLQQILIHLVYPEKAQDSSPEIHGKPLDPLPRKEASEIAEECLEHMRIAAEERFRIAPINLEPYVSLDKTGTQVFGIGVRRWLS